MLVILVSLGHIPSLWELAHWGQHHRFAHGADVLPWSFLFGCGPSFSWFLDGCLSVSSYPDVGVSPTLPTSLCTIYINRVSYLEETDVKVITVHYARSFLHFRSTPALRVQLLHGRLACVSDWLLLTSMASNVVLVCFPYQHTSS